MIKKKNRGFTLVEVMVAAAILSLVVTPILTSFVTIARVNAKSRRKLSATAIANSVMESVKGFELSQIAKECNFQSAVGVTVIPDFTGGTAKELDPGSLSQTTTPSVTYSSGKYTFTARADGKYAFSFTGVRLDGTKYDVLLTYTRTSDPDAEVVSGQTINQVLGPMSVRVLTYYEVDIKVFRGGAGFSSKPLAEITGTKADYN